MPLTLVVLALWALAFLTFNTVIAVRVWRLTHLPRWRRALPALLFGAALAASLSRATGTTVVAETLAFPLAAATALVGMLEVRRDRARPARPARDENFAGG
jgi:ABC-type spermidine/putrescine transport system permease subunit I